MTNLRADNPREYNFLKFISVQYSSSYKRGLLYCKRLFIQKLIVEINPLLSKGLLIYYAILFAFFAVFPSLHVVTNEGGVRCINCCYV